MHQTPSAYRLEQQFEDGKQQQDAATLGMWVFLATEIMFFGGLFLSYAVYRSAFAQAFSEGVKHNDVVLGTVNTGLLLTSSLFVALGVHSAEKGNRRSIIGMLVMAVTLGLAFLAIKAYEYHSHAKEGLLPGGDFNFAGGAARQVELFFYHYFAMTGLHALHMIVGIGLLLAMLVRASRGAFSERYFTPLEVLGLYWHFVDIVWAFLFPMFYLMGRVS